VVTTTDPATLPDKATWYLAANLPRPGGPRGADSVHPAETSRPSTHQEHRSQG
jgi:hypothetical protein